MYDMYDLCKTGKTICVTDRRQVRGEFLRQLEIVLEAEPWALILREKDMDKEAYRALAEPVLTMCRQAGVHCLFNMHLDLALELGAGGAQLPLAAAERLTLVKPPEFMLAVSVHSAQEAVRAAGSDADLLLYGHVFETQCKPGLAPRGLGSLREVCGAVSVPVFAIGGINEKNAPACMEAGASGVCMMSRFMQLE